MEILPLSIARLSQERNPAKLSQSQLTCSNELTYYLWLVIQAERQHSWEAKCAVQRGIKEIFTYPNPLFSYDAPAITHPYCICGTPVEFSDTQLNLKHHCGTCKGGSRIFINVDYCCAAVSPSWRDYAITNAWRIEHEREERSQDCTNGRVL